MSVSAAFTIFKAAKNRGASDIHLKVGTHPFFRIEGQLVRFGEHPVVTEEMMKRIVDEVTAERHKKILAERLSVDLAYEHPETGRLRINIFHQMGQLALVARLIPDKVRSFKELNLPKVIERLAEEERGLILVTGTTGSGKSTTLAAMIDKINRERSVRIITIEDPIEYVFKDELSLVSQRELGFDTPSFSQGLRDALREDPEVIMVGEMRDLETIETALMAAETGHLVMSTLHTLDAKETVNRIISMFPGYRQNQIRVQLASVLKAVISQRLIPTIDRKRRVPAVEVLVNTPRIRELILSPERFDELYEAMSEGFIPYGMQTFEQSLFYLWKKGVIDEETALDYATKREDLKLRMRGVASDRDEKIWKPFEEMALREREAERKAEIEAKPEETFFTGELKPEAFEKPAAEEEPAEKKFDLDELLKDIGIP